MLELTSCMVPVEIFGMEIMYGYLIQIEMLCEISWF